MLQDHITGEYGQYFQEECIAKKYEFICILYSHMLKDHYFVKDLFSGKV